MKSIGEESSFWMRKLFAAGLMVPSTAGDPTTPVTSSNTFTITKGAAEKPSKIWDIFIFPLYYSTVKVCMSLPYFYLLWTLHRSFCGWMTYYGPGELAAIDERMNGAWILINWRAKWRLIVCTSLFTVYLQFTHTYQSYVAFTPKL